MKYWTLLMLCPTGLIIQARAGHGYLSAFIKTGEYTNALNAAGKSLLQKVIIFIDI